MGGRKLRLVPILLALLLLSLLVICLWVASAGAELTVECRNGKTYRISTRGGLCRPLEFPNPDAPGGIEIFGGVCNAGKGNRAYVTCGGGCRSVTGSGSCDLVSEAAPID
jgi:hypothetical protein